MLACLSTLNKLLTELLCALGCRTSTPPSSWPLLGKGPTHRCEDWARSRAQLPVLWVVVQLCGLQAAPALSGL